MKTDNESCRFFFFLQPILLSAAIRARDRLHCKIAALQETRPLRCKNRTIVSFVIYNLPFIISFFFLLAAQRSYNEVVLQRSGLFPYLCSLFKTNVTQRNTIGRRKRNHVATYGRILYHPG